MKKFLAKGVAALLALTLTACGSGGGQGASSKEDAKEPAASTADAGEQSVKGKTVAFIPKVTGNAFFEAANQGAQKLAEEAGFKVEYMGDATASVSAQVAVINQAVASGVDAIVISTVDAEGVSDALKAAREAGIVVCTWDSDAKPEDRDLMVSQGTPEQLGQMLVEMSVSGLKQRGVDPEKDPVKYAWHYSQATVTDQNSWQVEGEKLIHEKYPNWINVNPDNYYSNQDAEKAITVGEAVLQAHPDIDLIICNDSTALPGQLQAAENKGLNQDKITITGYASPNAIKQYNANGTIYNWGLWDCRVQGGMGVYVAAYLAAGNEVKVGDKITIPTVGEVEIMTNDSIAEGAKTNEKNNGVILLPERTVYTKDNVNDYDF